MKRSRTGLIVRSWGGHGIEARLRARQAAFVVFSVVSVEDARLLPWQVARWYGQCCHGRECDQCRTRLSAEMIKPMAIGPKRYFPARGRSASPSCRRVPPISRRLLNGVKRFPDTRITREKETG
jgi:hypothetical protein